MRVNTADAVTDLDEFKGGPAFKHRNRRCGAHSSDKRFHDGLASAVAAHAHDAAVTVGGFTAQ